MRFSVILLATMLFQSAFASVEQAVNDTSRLEEAIVRDVGRRPTDILKFSGVKAGHKVVEIAPAGGYYTALLSRIVGRNGKVYAVDPERIFEFFPRGREGFPAYIEQDPRANVAYSSQNLDGIEIPEKVDLIFNVLYYHDTVWTGEDRDEMNRRFMEMLKPGGHYLIVDHHGVTGAPDSITQELHRVDAEIVRKDIEAAGFELVASSDVLRNESDPRDDSVFLEGRRGNTDRFVWLYRKPD